MACRVFSSVSFLFIFLLTNNLVSGRDLHQDLDIKYRQNTSISYVDHNKQSSRKLPVAAIEDVKDRFTHWAILRAPFGDYYGVKASLNVYGFPQLFNGQESSGEIWFTAGPEDELNTIQAGWHVFPGLYGDSDTHFFIKWTADGYKKTGCYNLKCPGFVRDNTTKFYPGYSIQNLSTYDGDQFDLTLKISKNFDTGDWWLFYGRNGMEPMGYWPRSLFNELEDSATDIDFGGTIHFYNGTLSPPMGSGHFASEGEKKSGFIKNIQFIDEGGNFYTLKDDDFHFLQDKPECYTVTASHPGEVTYYGGPGSCKD